MIKFQFFLTAGEKFLDEPGAEEVRDGPMVSLAKMVLMISTFRRIIIRSNLDTFKIALFIVTEIDSQILRIRFLRHFESDFPFTM
jgi:hypothetical protein